MSIGLARLLVGLVLAVCVVLPALAEQEAPVELYFRADIVIAADGDIAELAWHDVEKIPTKLQQRLTDAAQSWQFKPGSVDGVPAETRTILSLHLQASDVGDGQIGLALADAYTGASSNHRVTPDYPMAAVRRGIDAKLRVIISIDEDGEHTAKVVNYMASRKGDRWREDFSASALAAVADWKFQQELVAGRPVPAKLSIPVTYCIYNSRWCAGNALPEPNTAVGAVPPGAPVALDSVATLLTDIRKTKI